MCVFPPGFTGKEGEPLPLIVARGRRLRLRGHRSRGAPAPRGDLGATRILYVVGAPQQQHLAMVFAVAREAGWLAPPARAEHVAFGSVLGPDKKMLSRRAGRHGQARGLLDEAVERAAEWPRRTPTWTPPTRPRSARAVGIGAIKYADLSSDRMKDYVFDLDRMLAFDGNTAPYLQYAHAPDPLDPSPGRARAGARPRALSDPAPEEMALELLQLPSTL